MKKTIAFLVAAALSASLFCVSASATFRRGETKVWIPDEPGYEFHTPGLKLKAVPDSQWIHTSDMKAAVEAADPELLNVGVKIDADRMLVIEQMYASVPEENLPIQITFSVEEADQLSLSVFYCADGSDTWELVAVSARGPVVECELPANGRYAVAWGW